jgi:hypothetical protein
MCRALITSVIKKSVMGKIKMIYVICISLVDHSFDFIENISSPLKLSIVCFKELCKNQFSKQVNFKTIYNINYQTYIFIIGFLRTQQKAFHFHQSKFMERNKLLLVIFKVLRNACSPQIKVVPYNWQKAVADLKHSKTFIHQWNDNFLSAIKAWTIHKRARVAPPEEVEFFILILFFLLSGAGKEQKQQHRGQQRPPPGAEDCGRGAGVRVLEGAALGRVDAHVGQRLGDPVQKLGRVRSALEIAHFLHAVQERLLGAATHKSRFVKTVTEREEHRKSHLAGVPMQWGSQDDEFRLGQFRRFFAFFVVLHDFQVK